MKLTTKQQDVVIGVRQDENDVLITANGIPIAFVSDIGYVGSYSHDGTAGSNPENLDELRRLGFNLLGNRVELYVKGR